MSAVEFFQRVEGFLFLFLGFPSSAMNAPKFCIRNIQNRRDVACSAVMSGGGGGPRGTKDKKEMLWQDNESHHSPL